MNHNIYIRRFNKIHSGIFEGNRHVELLSPKAVSDFWDAIERSDASPHTQEQLIDINDSLPTLLYSVTRKSAFQHPLKNKVFEIIKYLIKKDWFCPKKQKTIFYRLLELDSSDEQLWELYLEMHPTHKVYFLLSVYGCWQSRGDRKKLLIDIVSSGLEDNDQYLWGFAIVISTKLEMKTYKNKYVEKISHFKGDFGLLKWLSTFDYLSNKIEERAAIRKLIGPSDNDLSKIYLLSNLTHLPTEYADEEYLKGLLKNSSVLLLPAACSLLVSAKNGGLYFTSLQEFILNSFGTKKTALSLITKEISKKREGSGIAEIENLRSLYEGIDDMEMKRVMQNSLTRIMQYGYGYDEDFAKSHKNIGRYNESYLFESLEDTHKYDYIELIPAETIQSHLKISLDEFKDIIEDFADKEILAPVAVNYNSNKEEIRLEFNSDRSYCVLDEISFSLDEKSILESFTFAAEIFNKACYFWRKTGKAPRISSDNLLVDRSNGKVVFRTIGKSLCTFHVIKEIVVGDEEADIAKMISILLGAMLFRNKEELAEFEKNKKQTSVQAFLKFFLQKMSTKDDDKRITASRFNYLIELISQNQEQLSSKNRLAIIYLRERLKAALFNRNSEIITWDKICDILNEHITKHIRDIFDRDSVKSFPFSVNVIRGGRIRNQPHRLSVHLMELAKARENVLDEDKIDVAYFDFVEMLLHYATVCVEVAAIGRTFRSKQMLNSLQNSPLLKIDFIKISASEFELNISKSELADLMFQEHQEGLFKSVIGLSLKQLAVMSVLNCPCVLSDNTLIANRTKGMNDNVFRNFAYSCLKRIPKIEDAVKLELERVFRALQSNDDYDKVENLEQIKNNISKVIVDFGIIRRKLGIVRQYGHAYGGNLPVNIKCKSRFRKSKYPQLLTIPGCKIMNNFPSKQKGYSCSWDIQDKKVTNLIIPSEGMNSLITDLTKGKIFGFKLSYVYSGKSMLIWDIIVLIFVGILIYFFEYNKLSDTASQSSKSIYTMITTILYWIFTPIVSIAVLYDLKHYIPSYSKFLDCFKRSNIKD